MFDIPIVLFIFRRSSTLKDILGRIREIAPSKVYILADEGRTPEEVKEAHNCRRIVESLIDWDCKVIKHYADSNRGVYNNIGEGAKWVFQREEMAIFLEDDNLPDVSFFRYAKEMLLKYKNQNNVLWVCGTNYFSEIESSESYKFTKHLLPCGWASWRGKFLQYYDGNLDSFSNRSKRKAFRKSYYPKLLRFVQLQSIKNEFFRKKKGRDFISWDYQMLWSVRSNDYYGIVPTRNLITNIGVDELSTHGGSTKSNIMTDRFCEVPSKALVFPLSHPTQVGIDKEFELELGRIICPPFKYAIKSILSSKMKHLLNYDTSFSWHDIIRGQNKE